jgi:hypothetical protein
MLLQKYLNNPLNSELNARFEILSLLRCPLFASTRALVDFEGDAPASISPNVQVFKG